MQSRNNASYGMTQIQKNVRFVLAKKKSQELFSKWMAQEGTEKLILELIKDVKNNNREKLINAPSPQLLENRSMLVSNSRSGSKQTPQTPPRQPANMMCNFIQ